MKNNLIGGITGAIALNILHQTAAKTVPNAPRVDRVGEEGVTKFAKAFGLKPPVGDALFRTTLIGDVISNGLFYSVAGLASNKKLLLAGAALGFSAGIGAITLTKPLGLNDYPVTKSSETKIMTVAWYLVGGLVAAQTIKILRQKANRL